MLKKNSKTIDLLKLMFPNCQCFQLVKGSTFENYSLSGNLNFLLYLLYISL